MDLSPCTRTASISLCSVLSVDQLVRVLHVPLLGELVARSTRSDTRSAGCNHRVEPEPARHPWLCGSPIADPQSVLAAISVSGSSSGAQPRQDIAWLLAALALVSEAVSGPAGGACGAVAARNAADHGAVPVVG